MDTRVLEVPADTAVHGVPAGKPGVPVDRRQVRVDKEQMAPVDKVASVPADKEALAPVDRRQVWVDKEQMAPLGMVAKAGRWPFSD